MNTTRYSNFRTFVVSNTSQNVIVLSLLLIFFGLFFALHNRRWVSTALEHHHSEASLKGNGEADIPHVDVDPTTPLLIHSQNAAAAIERVELVADPDGIALQQYNHLLHHVEQPCLSPGTLLLSTYLQMMGRSDVMTNYARYADKSAAKAFVRQKVAFVKTAKTLYRFTRDNMDAILTVSLPTSFAFKAVHGSGMNWFVKNNLLLLNRKGRYNAEPYTREQLMAKGLKWLARCYQCEKEKQYSTVIPAVIVEEYLDLGQDDDALPTDYKVWTMGGVPLIVVQKVSPHGAPHTGRLYSPEWEPMDDVFTGMIQGDVSPRPQCLPSMLEASCILAPLFRFARLDFYCQGPNLYFGEITFNPAGGNISCDLPYLLDRLDVIGLCHDSTSPTA